MKKLNKALLLLMLLLSACMKNEELVPGGHISAVMESEQTKTSVTDEGSFTWSAGDKVWIGTTSGGVVGTLWMVQVHRKQSLSMVLSSVK